MQAHSSEFLCRSPGLAPSSRQSSSGHCFCRKLSQCRPEGRKHRPPESERPEHPWPGQKVWMEKLSVTEERKTRWHTPWASEPRARQDLHPQSLGHDQYEERGLSPYPKKLLEQYGGREEWIDSYFPIFLTCNFEHFSSLQQMVSLSH